MRQELLAGTADDFHQVARRLHKMICASASPSSLTKAQAGILFGLQMNQAAGVTELAHSFGITPSATTQLVNGLVAHGLLARKEDVRDRRRAHLKVTKKGERALAIVKKNHARAIEKLLEALTDQELEQFRAMQQKIISYWKSHE